MNRRYDRGYRQRDVSDSRRCYQKRHGEEEQQQKTWKGSERESSWAWQDKDWTADWSWNTSEPSWRSGNSWGDDIRIELARRGLNDTQLQSWIDQEGPILLKHLGDMGTFDSVDLSQNELTDDGVQRLVRWLLECRVPARRVKLFRNQLKSPSALCKLIEDNDLGTGADTGLRELHLSSNNIGLEGLRTLLGSLGRAKKKAGKERYSPPIWLRVERNVSDITVEKAEEMVEEYKRQGLIVCLEGGMPEASCTIQSCKNGADVHFHVMGGNNSNSKGGRRQGAW